MCDFYSKRPNSPEDFVLQDDRGFTLIELVMVMVIIAIAIGVVLPRMPNLTGTEMDRSARKIGMMTRLVRDRAVTLRRYYRLDIDLEGSRMSALYFGPEENYIDDDQVRSLTLPEPLYFRDVVTDRGGKRIEGVAEVHFSPKGMIEPVVIHLADRDGNTLSILPDVLGGEIQMVDDYVGLSLQ